jgi:Zn-dependent peptidase ImmA (M78 family)
VLETIHKIGIAMLFRPLKGLLGAYVPTASAPGILLTTQRNLHIQRFTAAHELGHHVLEHRALSLDDEDDIGFVARGERTGHDAQEVAADAFASAFLLPDWLIVAHAKRHGWSKRKLAEPDIAYQMSLRLGVSYAATCFALSQANLVTPMQAQDLKQSTPKASKKRAAPDVQPTSWHPDVWLLSERDRGVQVLGNPDDFLVFALQEHIAAGYAWDTSNLVIAGLTVEKDERQDGAGDAIGGPVTRRLVAQGSAVGHVRLEERRPWERSDDTLNTFELDLKLVGPEPGGLPRVAREAIAA